VWHWTTVPLASRKVSNHHTEKAPASIEHFHRSPFPVASPYRGSVCRMNRTFYRLSYLCYQRISVGNYQALGPNNLSDRIILRTPSLVGIPSAMMSVLRRSRTAVARYSTHCIADTSMEGSAFQESNPYSGCAAKCCRSLLMAWPACTWTLLATRAGRTPLAMPTAKVLSLPMSKL